MIQYNNSNPDNDIAVYEGGDEDKVVKSVAGKETGRPSDNDMDNALNTLKMIENREIATVDTNLLKVEDVVED